MELKKFSLGPEKFGSKRAFEGLVNQFEEYTTLEQWSNNERSSLLFLSLMGSAMMYFVGLLELDNMAYLVKWRP